MRVAGENKGLAGGLLEAEQGCLNLLPRQLFALLLKCFRLRMLLLLNLTLKQLALLGYFFARE